MILVDSFQGLENRQLRYVPNKEGLVLIEDTLVSQVFLQKNFPDFDRAKHSIIIVGFRNGFLVRVGCIDVSSILKEGE